MPSDTTLEATGEIEAVIRFKVLEEEQSNFQAQLNRILTESRRRDSHPKASIRLLQGVVGSNPFQWELRVRVDSMQELGAILDRWSDTGSEARSLLSDLMGIRGATVVDDGVPVYRVWS
jgi:hypothetical protein